MSDTNPSKEVDGLGIDKPNVVRCYNTYPSSKETNILIENMENGNQNTKKSKKNSKEEEDAERLKIAYPSKEVDEHQKNIKLERTSKANGLGINKDNAV